MTNASTSARDEILHAVRAALPPKVAPPAPRTRPDLRRYSREELVARFTQSAEAAGATVIHATRDHAAHVQHAASDAHEILSFLPGVASTIATPIDPHSLASLDLLVCAATIGVAECGAVWFATSDPIQRAALFIAQRVIIVVSAKSVVPDLHDAYERIDVRANTFGTFVSGPSKTADIEQSLVIGAHGPKELTLIISAE